MLNQEREPRLETLEAQVRWLKRLLATFVLVAVAGLVIAAQDAKPKGEPQDCRGSFTIRDDKGELTGTVLQGDGNVEIGRNLKIKSDVEIGGILKINGVDQDARMKAMEAQLRKKNEWKYTSHDETIGVGGFVGTITLPVGTQKNNKAYRPGNVIAAWCDFGRAESLHELDNFEEISVSSLGAGGADLKIKTRAAPRRAGFVIRVHMIYE